MNTPNLFFDSISNIIYINNIPTASLDPKTNKYLVVYGLCYSDTWDFLYGADGWEGREGAADREIGRIIDKLVKGMPDISE